MPTKELAIISARPDNSPIKELVGQHLVRLAELIRKDGAPYPLTPQLVNVWVDVFERSNLKPEQVEATFHKAERACKFWPSPADVLGLITTAGNNASEEEAARKFDCEVLPYATRRSPDIRDKNPPRISEHTRRAINAAGGLDFLRECDRESLQWARKRFIEAYIRYAELQQDEYLLPDGEIKNLLTGLAQAKMLPAPDWSECRARGEAYRSELASQGPSSLSPEERLRVADELADAARKVLEQPREHVIVVSDEGRTALHRQGEMLKRSYPMRPEAFAENPQLRKIYERFGLEIPESAQSAQEPPAVEAQP